MKNIKYLLLIISLIYSGCSKEEEVSKTDYPEFAIIDISEDTYFDFAVYSKNSDDYIYVKSNDLNNEIPTSVLYYNSNANKKIAIFYNTEGSINKVIINEYILVFENFVDNKFDVGIISPDGEIEILRDVVLENDLNKKTSISNYSKKTSSWQVNLLKTVSVGVDFVPCAMAIIEAKSWNLSAFLSSFECGLSIGDILGEYLAEQGVSIDASPEFVEGFENIDEFISVFLTSLSVSNCDWKCILGIMNDSFLKDYIINLENRDEDIQITKAALKYGYGDVQVTLTWNNGADIDLHVIDPFGERIYFDHKHSASGGQLDIDDRNGYGPENIFWPHLKAPEGIYKVYVHHYPSTPYSSNYTVLINAFDHIKKHNGSIDNDKFKAIAEFDKNSIRNLYSKKNNEFKLKLIK